MQQPALRSISEGSRILKRVLYVRVDVSASAAALVAVAKIQKRLQCRSVGARMGKARPARVGTETSREGKGQPPAEAWCPRPQQKVRPDPIREQRNGQGGCAPGPWGEPGCAARGCSRGAVHDARPRVSAGLL